MAAHRTKVLRPATLSQRAVRTKQGLSHFRSLFAGAKIGDTLDGLEQHISVLLPDEDSKNWQGLPQIALAQTCNHNTGALH